MHERALPRGPVTEGCRAVAARTRTPSQCMPPPPFLPLHASSFHSRRLPPCLRCCQASPPGRCPWARGGAPRAARAMRRRWPHPARPCPARAHAGGRRAMAAGPWPPRRWALTQATPLPSGRRAHPAEAVVALRSREEAQQRGRRRGREGRGGAAVQGAPPQPLDLTAKEDQRRRSVVEEDARHRNPTSWKRGSRGGAPAAASGVDHEDTDADAHCHHNRFIGPAPVRQPRRGCAALHGSSSPRPRLTPAAPVSPSRSTGPEEKELIGSRRTTPTPVESRRTYRTTRRCQRPRKVTKTYQPDRCRIRVKESTGR
ncbi:translation initiation factor IF-2-like isoform X1 [Panicum virgatum]|nr:translation initiation factor IF-2-like isoform X1 [Panicum virgatum]